MEKRYILNSTHSNYPPTYLLPIYQPVYLPTYTVPTYLIKVEFRIGCLDASNKRFAVEITAKRERLRAVVESVKGEVYKYLKSLLST